MPKPKHQYKKMKRDALPPDVGLAMSQFENDLSSAIRSGEGQLSKGKYKIFWNNRRPKKEKGAAKETRAERARRKALGPVDPLPPPEQGHEYREIRVGEARPDDPNGVAGKRRLIVELNQKALRVIRIYFTNDHYRGEWFEIPKS